MFARAAPAEAPETVISGDGVDASRWVIVVNETMPGPSLEVYTGQQVIVTVVNHLHTETVSSWLLLRS